MTRTANISNADVAQLDRSVEEAARLLTSSRGAAVARRACSRYGLADSDADDVVQECVLGLRRTFERRVARGESIPDGEELERYVWRSVTNTACDWFRQDARRPDHVVAVHHDDDFGPEDALARAAIDEEIPVGGSVDVDALRRRLFASSGQADMRGCSPDVVLAVALHVVARVLDGQTEPAFLGVALEGGTTLRDRCIWEGLALSDPERFSEGASGAALRQRKRRCQIGVISLIEASYSSGDASTSEDPS